MDDALDSMSPLAVNVALSICAGMLTYSLIPAFIELFLQAKLFGHDINKVARPQMYAMGLRRQSSNLLR